MLQNGRGGGLARVVLPVRNGGGGVLEMLKGVWHNKFWGILYGVP